MDMQKGACQIHHEPEKHVTLFWLIALVFLSGLQETTTHKSAKTHTDNFFVVFDQIKWASRVHRKTFLLCQVL